MTSFLHPNDIAFVIAGPIEDNEQLYWSNDHGWGDLEGATIFDRPEDSSLSMPVGGCKRVLLKDLVPAMSADEDEDHAPVPR